MFIFVSIPTLVHHSVTSSTIKSVHGFCDTFTASTTELWRHTPQLQNLSVGINIRSSFTDFPTNITSITRLDLLFTRSWEFSSLVNLLRRIPNVNYLKLNMIYHGISAQIWERLIPRYLPRLKTLHFKMNFDAVEQINAREQQVEQIVNTFRNPFWLDEHRWFVQCDWHPMFVRTIFMHFSNSIIKRQDRSWAFDDELSCLHQLQHILEWYHCLTSLHICDWHSV